MFKVNRKMEYAFVALHHIKSKKKDALTTAKEISTEYNIPFDPTSRVLQIMTQYEILKASQGAKGGYKLNKDLSKLKLKDFSEIIAGPMDIGNCLGRKEDDCKNSDTCAIISPFKKINNKLNHLFESITVDELIDTHKKGCQRK